MLSVHLWARININIIRLLWKIPERYYNQRFLRRRTGEKRKERDKWTPFWMLWRRWVSLSLNTLSSSFTEQTGLSFHSLFSLLKGHGWILKRKDFGNLSSGRRGFQLVFEKGLSETRSRVITSTTFLSMPCTRFAFSQDVASKGSSEICGVTASGVGTVSVREWPRCSRAEDTEDAPQ